MVGRERVVGVGVRWGYLGVSREGGEWEALLNVDVRIMVVIWSAFGSSVPIVANLHIGLREFSQEASYPRCNVVVWCNTIARYRTSKKE